MKYKITLENRVYEVEVEKGEAALLADYEASVPVPTAKKEESEAIETKTVETVAGSGSDRIIVAPLPGTVLDVMVTEGDMINNGDVVAIIEAMKMENEVIAVIAGKVVNVLVTKGNTVNTGDQLFILD